MRADQNHRRWLAGCWILILLLAAGCYQQGSGVEPQPLSPIQPGPTNTLPPTETPFPTPEPLDEPVEEPFEQPDTTDPFFQDNPDLAAPVDIAPTSDFFGEVPTTDPFGSAAAFPTIDISGGVAQVPTEENPFFQEQIPEEQLQIDPVFLTATAIIAGATATESFNMTATALGFGIGVPTFTPTPTATTFVEGQPQPPTGADCVYTVQRGDNLFRIARNYNVDLQTLANYNNIANASVILVGQQITIPNCGGGQPPVGVTSVPPVTGGCASPYTVQQGDTLFKISLRCNVPVMSIASANGIQNINLILINQQLTIPPA